MWTYLFLGTKGGRTRFEIVRALWDGPRNTNQVAGDLAMHYKTVQHHLRLLEARGVVVTSPRGAYGALFFLAPDLRRDGSFLREVGDRLGAPLSLR